MIPFTALRNFEFFSMRPSAAARSKPESCFCGLGFVGASNLFCGLGGGWSGDRAAWRSSAASAGSGRLWGGDEALCRNEPGWLWGGDPALSRRKDMAARRADGVSTLLHNVHCQSLGLPSRCDCAAAVCTYYVYQCGVRSDVRGPHAVSSRRLIDAQKSMHEKAAPRTRHA